MKKTRIAASLALGLALLSPLAGARQVDTAWWDVKFETGYPPEVQVEIVGVNRTFGGEPAAWTIGELGSLTNNYDTGARQPYASGLWIAQDGDESCITNGVVTNFVDGAFVEDSAGTYLKLDTQGGDLTWSPTNVVANGIALVDADLLLVGSDSAPDPSDFDGDSEDPVQTAVYLMNEVDEDTGETTNSLLCVYASSDDGKSNVWHPLDGVELDDNSWHHVQVLVDYTDNHDQPELKVYVDGVLMHAFGNAEKISWTVAHWDLVKNIGKVQTVSFRGTGAVDNFVGTTRVEELDDLTFAAEVRINGNLIGEEDATDDNYTRYKIAKAGDPGSGKTVTFTGLRYFDYDMEIGEPPTYVLQKIELTNFVTGATTVYTFGYNDVTLQIESDAPKTVVDFDTTTVEDPDSGEEVELFYGPFSVTAVTDGAVDPTNTAVRVYFKSLGAFDVYAEKYDDGSLVDTETYSFVKDDVAEGDTQEFSFPYAKTVNGSNYVLSAIEPAPGLVPVPGASAATVTAALYGRNTDLRAAQAYYVPGDYAGKAVVMKDPVEGSSAYTFFGVLAKVLADPDDPDDEDEYCQSLREAVEDYAQAGDTIVLLGDDRVSFSATATEIVIDKALTIDGGSNTLYGVTDYAYDGHNDHDLFIASSAGDVTIKNLTLSEFSDTAPTVQYRTYPIWTSQAYAGTLVLDGVTVEKFARTAINLGNGDFVITNCAVKGYAGDAGAPTRYFQNAITVKDAKGTVADSTVTGIGSTAEPWGAGLVTFNSDGDGEVTFKSGTYTADYLIEVSSNATGKAVFEGGTFIATGTEESAFQLDEGEDATFYVNVTGGWFDRKPEAAVTVVRAPYTEVLDVDNAPDPAAEWTVVRPCTITFFEEDGTTEFFKATVLSGTTGYGPANDPAKAETAQYAYVFTGWTNAVDGGETVSTANLPAATGDAAWTATFSVVLKTYDIVFLASDAIGAPVFFETNVFYGATDYGPTNAPTRESTVSTDFAFAGWTNADTGAFYAKDAALPEATTNATYTALYGETARKYEITWNMDDGTLIDTTEVEYGTVPTHAAPSKPDTEQFAYVFTGWDPEVVAVEGEAAYAATFSVVVRSYDIRFFDGDEQDGEEPYFTTNAPYGTPAALYAPADPTKDATSLTNFTFAGWTNEVYGGAALLAADLPTVSNETSWVAVWTETPIWRVTFSNGRLGYDDLETNVVDGTMLAQPETPAGIAPVDTVEGYDYEFAGWALPETEAAVTWPQEITGDVNYHAVFTSNATEYAITVELNGGRWAAVYTPPTSYTVESPEISIPDPVQDGFVFAGWTNALGEAVSAVIPTGSTGDKSFGATWTVSDIHVNPGDGLAEYAAQHVGETVPEPIEFVEPAAPLEEPKAKIAFVAPAAGTYVLLSSTTLATPTDTWSQDEDSVPVQAAAGDLVQLIEGSSEKVKFFAIGWEAPSGD